MSDHDYPSGDLLPLAALASILGVRPADLRAEVDEGRLPHVRLGAQSILLDEARVRAILCARAAEAAGEVQR